MTMFEGPCGVVTQVDEGCRAPHIEHAHRTTAVRDSDGAVLYINLWSPALGPVSRWDVVPIIGDYTITHTCEATSVPE